MTNTASADGPGSHSLGDDARSLLAGYRPGLFVDHASWRSLRRILHTRGGGSYGLAGPRGSGKSWMMEEALTWANESEGIGVWFPSPSEYEPMAFLAAISDHVAIGFETYYDEQTNRPTRAARARYRRTTATSLALLYVAVGYLVVAFFGNKFGIAPTALLGFAIVAGLVVVALAVRSKAREQLREESEGLGRVRSKAEELRQQVRYIATTKESSELGAEAGYGGLVGRLKRARERQLVERPATLSSLIHNFRAFVELVAREVQGPVVIAIDELDKMSDAERVAQLLRDIKGIFDIRGTCFLVSLSDEASRSLSLGGVRARNEFNSSFYAVVTVPPLPPADCVGVLRRRLDTYDARTAVAVGVMTGGVPREVVRVGERVMDRTGGWASPGDAVAVAADEELDAFVADVLATADPVSNPAYVELDGDVQVGLVAAVERARHAIRADPSRLFGALLDEWHLNERSAAWRRSFQEEWRRLLVRLGVGAVLARDPSAVGDGEKPIALQAVIASASRSAVVARAQLADYLTRCLTGDDEDGELDTSCSALTFFLLSRNLAPFRTDDYEQRVNGREAVPADALEQLRDRGVLERTRAGRRWQWSVSEAAARRILPAAES